MRWPICLALVLVVSMSKTGRASDPGAAELARAIDEQIDARLTAERVQPAELADDAEFLRRIYLDLHGVVPSLEQAERFLSDSTPDKRARLIESLLSDPRYGQYMADIWQGYLISPLADDRKVRSERFRQWLADEFNNSKWDQSVSRLLTATGKMEQNPGVIYLMEGRQPRSVTDLADLTSRYFLGVRLNCAQCHDHPVVDWKQEDFWGMAAFFTQIQTPKRAKQIYEKGIIDDPKLTLSVLRDSGAPDGFLLRSATFLGGQEPAAGKATHRQALADWITSADNPYFARATVNRTWWRLFGRGIVQPVDDMHQANRPSHPELLDLLSRRFVESEFDLKFLTRAIVLSRAYQRTSRPGDATSRQAELFGRMEIKVLSAGQVYDSLETIFGPPAKVTGIDARQGARWEFIQFFGEAGDPDPTVYRRGIPHLLRQMNSGQFAGRNTTELLSRLQAAKRQPIEIGSDLFLAILSRRPTVDELGQVERLLGKSDDAQSVLDDLAWALMMTSEFSLNH